MQLRGKSILLVISGGIAAYKSLELIRLLRKDGAKVRCILTKGGAEFITPLSVSSLSENPVYTDLWSLKDEVEMGHIRLSREADLIVVAPASANIIAQIAHGLAQDLASTTLLASNKPILLAPAMNHMMWMNPATQENIKILASRGILQIGPEDGDMACGEHGPGRMAEPQNIVSAITSFFFSHKPLAGKTALVTSGPTFEPIDPVRYIGNRSSGKQGHAIAKALNDAGAAVTLITGPVSLPDPHGVETLHVETAADMLHACLSRLPCDIAVCTAAVSDWKVENYSAGKIKKAGKAPVLTFHENPDILATIAADTSKRPALVIGFAAETDNLLQNATEKLKKKGADLIVANDVSSGVFGAEENSVILISKTSAQQWGKMPKEKIASLLVDHIMRVLTPHSAKDAAE